jgi:hypothetical protein
MEIPISSPSAEDAVFQQKEKEELQKMFQNGTSTNFDFYAMPSAFGPPQQFFQNYSSKSQNQRHQKMPHLFLSSSSNEEDYSKQNHQPIASASGRGLTFNHFMGQVLFSSY